MSLIIFFHCIALDYQINKIIITLESFALGDANDVNHLVLAENALDGHFLFKMFASKVNFVGNTTTIELDFNNVRLFNRNKEIRQIFKAIYFDRFFFCKNIQRESSIVFKSRVFMCPYLFSSLYDK